VDGIVIVVQDAEKAQEVRSLWPTLHVIVRPFHYHWGEMFNHVIGEAETCGYDALLRLDPDECMFGSDIAGLRSLLDEATLVRFPRYNFWGDRLHYVPVWWPDFQTRAFPLHQDIYYEGQHHEALRTEQPRQSIEADTPIFHYGWVGKRRILERDLHYLNVEREKEGLAPLGEFPYAREFPSPPAVPVLFDGAQPLSPALVGMYAPFEE
jgi:hypothetical protein